MFELEPKITKEFILSKLSQEEIYEFYGVPVKKGLFCSPTIIRSDKNPTCSFYKNKKGDLIYKDFAGPTFNIFSLVMFLFNCSYYKALRIIANDFGLFCFPKMEKNLAKIEYSGTIIKETQQTKIEVEIQEFTKKELDWWNSFGISLKTLNKFKVYSIKSVFLNGYYHTSSSETTPIYGYYGGINSEDNELWRLYFPTKRKFRFLNNWSATLYQGSKQLPKEGKHCLITKSLKDVMLLHEFGFISIAPVSENIVISESKYSKLEEKFNSVFLLFDNDYAGVRSANKYKKQYLNCRCIFIRRNYSKDISDLYKKISRNQFWEVVKELNEIISNKDIRKTKHFYIF